MQIPGDMLGFRGDPKWQDMSDYLVHFTSREALLNILDTGHLEARNEFGWFRSDAATRSLRLSACFSEVPIDQIDRLARRRGHYGIGFRRDFVRSQGGARVWYAEKPQSTHLFGAFNDFYRSDTARANELWKLTPFIDEVRADYDFTWEREWRLPGGLRFTLADVEFLLVSHGDDAELFRNPAPGVPLLSVAGADFWANAWRVLGSDEDRYVDQFLRAFGNPVDHLMWDSEDKKYFWYTPEWRTAEAIDFLFNDLDTEAEGALCKRLDDISGGSWINLAELHIWAADAN